MKSIIIKLASVAVSCSLIFGCLGNSPTEAGGTLIGAAAGGLMGAQFGKGKGRLAAVGIGTLIGALAGGTIGRHMNSQDKQMAGATTQRALETQPDNVATAWHNPNNNHQGNIIVTKTQSFPQQNKVCRDYVHTVTIDGQQERVHGRACRNVQDPRAMWVVQE